MSLRSFSGRRVGAAGPGAISHIVGSVVDGCIDRGSDEVRLRAALRYQQLLAIQEQQGWDALRERLIAR
jgi:hypothetical protein